VQGPRCVQGNRVLNNSVPPVIAGRHLSREEASRLLTSSFRRRPESSYPFSQQGTAAVQCTFLGSGFRRNDGQKLSPRHALAEDGKLDAIALPSRPANRQVRADLHLRQ
jgi:hypothetical protein